jgi:hypothetical protein
LYRRVQLQQVIYDFPHQTEIFRRVPFLAVQRSSRSASSRIQQIEQIFDIGKNYADMLPLRVRTEETFRGHLLITFVATVVLKRIQDVLKSTSVTPMSLFLNLRNHKCEVYQDKVITQEAFKKANDGYKLFGIKRPVTIPHKTICG